VRLHVGVLGAEQLASQRRGFRLDAVDVVAAGVKAMLRKALAYLSVRRLPIASCTAKRAVVFAGDELEVLALIAELLDDGRGDAGRGRRNVVE